MAGISSQLPSCWFSVLEIVTGWYIRQIQRMVDEKTPFFYRKTCSLFRPSFNSCETKHAHTPFFESAVKILQIVFLVVFLSKRSRSKINIVTNNFTDFFHQFCMRITSSSLFKSSQPFLNRVSHEWTWVRLIQLSPSNCFIADHYSTYIAAIQAEQSEPSSCKELLYLWRIL